MKIILFIAAFLISTTSYGQYVYDTETRHRIDVGCDRYNDSANVLSIDMIRVAYDTSGDDSAVFVYYRYYDGATGKDYVTPAYDWFPYAAYQWLVMNDIDKLNKYVFKEYCITVLNRRRK